MIIKFLLILPKKYFLPRVKIENYNIEIDGRNFYDQPFNDLIKQYDQTRKISTGQGDDYTTGCLLDFAYFEKYYRLIAGDLSKQKALDADSRAIQQIIFTGKIKAPYVVTKFCNYIYMVEYSKVNVKLSDTQLKKLKRAAKNKTGTTLRISLKMFNGNNLLNELLLTTRQKTKLTIASNNNMSTDLKLKSLTLFNLEDF